jgi:hypothetical protein
MNQSVQIRGVIIISVIFDKILAGYNMNFSACLWMADFSKVVVYYTRLKGNKLYECL